MGELRDRRGCWIRSSGGGGDGDEIGGEVRWRMNRAQAMCRLNIREKGFFLYVCFLMVVLCTSDCSVALLKCNTKQGYYMHEIWPWRKFNV